MPELYRCNITLKIKQRLRKVEIKNKYSIACTNNSFLVLAILAYSTETRPAFSKNAASFTSNLLVRIINFTVHNYSLYCDYSLLFILDFVFDDW